MAKDFTKVYDENARLKDEIAKLKEDKKDLISGHFCPNPQLSQLASSCNCAHSDRHRKMDWETIDKLRTELAENDIFKEFIRHVIKVHCWGIEEIDGGDAQDKALELGLIEAHIATEEDGDPEFDEYEVGDTIYRFSDMLKGA